LNNSGKTQSLFASPQKRSVILCLLLVVVTLALYNSVTHHPFVNFDDDRYITNNFHVRAGLNWNTVVWAFTTFDQANWHPLTWLSHALDCQLFGLNPAGHHYVNVLFHALNVVLLFLLLQRATRCTWPSLMVAALFAVHPVNVESVAWIAERKNLLSMMFFLLALWTYGSYARKPRAGPYLAVMALFACGLMAKPMVITFPCVLLLWDYWPLQRLWPDPSASHEPPPYPSRSALWLVLEKIPLFALSAASALVTMKAQAAGGAVRTITEYPLRVRLANSIVSYARYVGKAFWPVNLAPMYPHPGNSLKTWQVALAAVFLLAVTALVIAARQKRYLSVGWFWFLGTLVPMIGLVQVGAQAMADRYAYLPYVGLFLMVCWSAAELAWQKRAAPRWLAAGAAAVLIALSAVTYRQLGYWSDNVTLWTHTIQVTRANFVAEDNLGGALVIEGKIDQAMPHFRAAAAINPEDPVANLNIATNLQQQGKVQQAIARYRIVLRMTPDAVLRANTFSNLGAAYRGLGDDARAKSSYEAALRLVPESPHAFIGLGLIAQKEGDFKQAIRLYGAAMALQPTDVGYLLLAKALQQAGKTAEAQAALQDAKRLSANLPQAQQVADRLLAQ
jgi:protein O-mannosyl-transferase